MRKFCKVISVILTVLFVIMIPVNVVVRMFDNTISLLMAGNTFWKLENADPNANYFESDYASEEERLAAGKDLCYQVEAEGAALLLNNGALPLDAGIKVSTLSVNSVDLTYGGTGSGNVDASEALNLKQALQQSGFTVNETLWNWYLSDEAAALKDAVSNGESAGESAVLAGQAPILEIDPANYPQDVKNSISEYGDAVVITFSRVGGEGYDCAFPGYVDNNGNVSTENYLELNENERKLMAYVDGLKADGKIRSIIVLINTSNALEVDFLNDYAVDACMWVGGLGIKGTEAVTDILAGKVNPSGSLVDTYCYDNFSSPAMQNFIAQNYIIADGVEVDPAISTYMVYQEGIYVGYRYYETRYEDSVLGGRNANGAAGIVAGETAWSYTDEVAYPFGYGSSYTQFEYSDYSVKKVGENYEVSLTIQNIGDTYTGKDVMQIYLQKPYTEYDIANKVEKSAVDLVGFAKTKNLAPGEKQTLTVTVKGEEFKTYDSYGAGTYILEKGDYYLAVGTDSHDAVNNILAAKGKTIVDGMDKNGNADFVEKIVISEDDFEKYSKSTYTDYNIQNQFNDADVNL